ncbi:MAG: ankyrin repeat domain-containing protein [Puniceicoccales bacterium]|jgi:hypothetical protein|nr:ankyrin repeat domain-containing protein [Puniceicoccales bacterium]
MAKYSKIGVGCLLMACVTSETMGSGKGSDHRNALRKLENGVPVPQIAGKRPLAGKRPPKEEKSDQSKRTFKGSLTLTSILDRYRQMRLEDMRYKEIIADLERDCEKFKQDFNRQVALGHNLSIGYRDALFIVAMIWSDRDSMEKLVNVKIDWNDDLFMGWPASHYAVFLKRHDYLQFCFNHGAHPNDRNSKRYTLLMAIVEQGDVGMLKAALKFNEIDFFFRDINGKSALDYAFERGNSKIIALLEDTLVPPDAQIVDSSAEEDNTQNTQKGDLEDPDADTDIDKNKDTSEEEEYSPVRIDKNGSESEEYDSKEEEEEEEYSEEE